ncbi:catalase [Fibrella sp. HMF5335]|uniref:Catalase n=1 Tax=Fibrella rubiginis TaxID=2817060 RepID=A0A939GL31_9BACT|nr:catalase [Fibrella rubiginis]MBO0939299.1 catalase [Fibrella rubiginis]
METTQQSEHQLHSATNGQSTPEPAVTIPAEHPLKTSNHEPLTTNVGQPIATDQNSLRAGERGPTLLEDYVLREKLQHFDHERIPERIVHARGAAAHGFFQLYDSLEDLTTAKVLTDTSAQTPVFVRFSTVAGSRGSADTARDVRGFAVKMYTTEGNWDIVGNNIPVFFIQDAIKFPDLIHAAKPEPDREIPQAATAHDTFWDFISLTPESMHMVMWIMSDRTLPRSFGMMEGFGVHTFRLVNAKGESTFVKFHWKPLLGVHSLVWDEAQQIAGKDADFHRRSMWDSIKAGNFLEWELGIQTLPEADEQKYDFDILDATKLWPEELLPVRRVGKMTLNRNPDNYFAETEQVAFNTTNVVPGIDFSNDPLLQGRNFSYLDTQLSRLGSPNFTELPINRPRCPVSNNQRDAQMRHTIDKGRVSYAPASLDGHSPDEVTPARGGFVSYPASVNGPKVRARSQSFDDHYGQAKLFWNSMSGSEKEHIVKALQFELSMVETRTVRQRMLKHLLQINHVLAEQVASALGELVADGHNPAQSRGTADSIAGVHLLAGATSETTASGGVQQSKALSMQDQPTSAKGRKVAILVANDVDSWQVATLQEALQRAGSKSDLVGLHIGRIQGHGGTLEVTKTLANSSSVLYDAVFVVGGPGAAALQHKGDAHVFVAQAYKHGKPVAATGEGVDLLTAALPTEAFHHKLGVIAEQHAAHQQQAIKQFVDIVGTRHWNRPDLEHVAA